MDQCKKADRVKKLSKEFFKGCTIDVAQNLLGQVLVRVTETGKILKGKIVETEAYLGLKDECCHSFNDRRTLRTEPMYLPAGHAYIYFIYGKYYCFNIVTGNTQEPEAVLIRALEPLEGLEEMAQNRNKSHKMILTKGPGNLCQALGITKELNRECLFGSKADKIFLLEGKKQPQNKASGFRIGLPLKNDHAFLPLRFYISDSPFVSASSQNKEEYSFF